MSNFLKVLLTIFVILITIAMCWLSFKEGYELLGLILAIIVIRISFLLGGG
jgi:hypothetical protein